MTVDRSKWVPGPWDGEPDRVEFRHAEFPCLLLRGGTGAWCGYVAVPPGHAAHGKGYDDVDVSVHGGLTYADSCGGEICHVPEPGEPDDVWWLGFDCCHASDVSPKSESMSSMYPELPADLFRPLLGTPTGWGGVHEYRTVDYVRAETERLAEQLRGMAQ